MKKHYFKVLCAGLLAIGLSTVAQAALIDRGAGLIYDDVLDVTWLQDANYAGTQYAETLGMQGDFDGKMRWDAAQTWVGGLTYQGYTGWRLPTIEPLNGSSYNFAYTYKGNSDRGYSIDSQTSELGYMFHVNLGYHSKHEGFSMPDPYGSDENSIFGSSLRSDVLYWSGSEAVVGGTEVLSFNMADGFQGKDYKTSNFLTWAVHDGDIAAVPVPAAAAVVPVPAAVWLFGSGLMGLLGFGRLSKRG